ncbi:MAG: MFS transporter [Clostridia bacterium]|nr:MFS transporter [Clostridia bacterium]
MENKYKRLKSACYLSNVSMSVVGNLPPLLFLTFRELYGISFTLLGTLVLVNFVTQLLVDLAFSFFSHRFNIEKTVRAMPCLTALGLIVFTAASWVAPRFVYPVLLLGTVIFSAGAGLGEVLISPVIAALPAKDPDREMSKLHSVYAWGVVGIVPLATLFIHFFGRESWPFLVLAFSAVPVLSAILYATVSIPPLKTEERTGGVLKYLKNKSLWACVAAIFLGGAAECTMAQWSSTYIENALGIEKMWGDIFGVALFGAALGLGRTLYAKFGKNIGRVIFFGGVGACLCYATAVFVNVPLVGLLACALCGFFVSMLWPGNLVVSTERFPNGGVFIFAMMAAGGDLGASVVPQLVGAVTDAVSTLSILCPLADQLGITTEQLGMKCGMLVAMLFPLAALPLYYVMWRKKPKTRS